VTDTQPRDDIYAAPLERVERFRFDERVAAVFPNMLRRSVPGYEVVVASLGLIAQRYVTPGSTVFDLGCSHGAATAAVRARLGGVDCRLVAVDNAPAMIARAGALLDGPTGPPVELRCVDIREVVVERASLVVLNYTLQFVPPAERLTLLRRIRDGMLPGGVLVLSEKVRGADAHEDRVLTELHDAFKRANGYSDLEISQKRAALEQVLVAEALSVHLERLREAGFTAVETWFRCLNFASLLAHA
jgi:tRNA (cmo5U34)-methyltransferase